MSTLQVDDISDAAGTGSPKFSQGYRGGPEGGTKSDANQTLTDADPRVIVMTPTADRDVTLATTSIKAGDTYTICNNSSATGGFELTVKSSDASAIATVYGKQASKFVALQDTPTSDSHWLIISQEFTQWEEKEITSAITTDTNFLDFTNLTVGKTYRYSGAVLGALTGSDTQFRVDINDGTTDFHVLNFERDDTGLDINIQSSFYYIFVAATTTIQCTSAGMSTGASIVEFDAGKPSTWAILEELPYHVNVSTLS